MSGQDVLIQMLDIRTGGVWSLNRVLVRHAPALEFDFPGKHPPPTTTTTTTQREVNLHSVVIKKRSGRSMVRQGTGIPERNVRCYILFGKPLGSSSDNENHN